jgi:Tryptophan-associated transmembrane protein (Trp_oprn_chp)
MTARRELATVILTDAAGAALVLFAGSRVWLHVATQRPAPLPPLVETRTGAALHPWLTALALVALAGAGALLATRGALRQVVGVLMALCGAAAAATAAAAAHPTGWPLLAAGGGVLILAAGVAAAIRGGRWPAMGTRYDRPRTVSRPGLWEAIDRGEDPTS